MINEPLCKTCQFFKGRPTVPGESAKCAVKNNTRNVYFKGENCNLYKERVSNGIRKK